MESTRPMTVLITGGLGNLGCWLTRHFVQAGSTVYVLSHSAKKITGLTGFNFIQCDITNFIECKKKLEPLAFDYVIHVASANDSFVENYSQKALMVNAGGTRNILGSIQDKKIKKFVYISTFHVYGIENMKIDETCIPKPKNDYALTHLFAEKYIRQFHDMYNIPYLILRISNSYGCPIDIHTSKWYLAFNDMAKSAYENRKIVLKSNGNARRDFIWMGDVCNIISQLLKSAQANNAILNLCSGKSNTIFEIAEFVKQAYGEYSGKKISIEINAYDKRKYSDNLLFYPEKLLSIIDFHFNIRFKQEAIKIFELLKDGA